MKVSSLAARHSILARTVSKAWFSAGTLAPKSSRLFIKLWICNNTTANVIVIGTFTVSPGRHRLGSNVFASNIELWARLNSVEVW